MNPELKIAGKCTKRFGRLLLVFAVGIMLLGCRQEERTVSPPPVPAERQSEPAKVLFSEPASMQQVELATEALAVWRSYADLKPGLLLLSDQPMLHTVPEAVRVEAKDFISTASREELARRSRPFGPDLLLLPDTTVDCALRAGWFANFVWALPLRDAEQEFFLEPFRGKLLERGLLNAEEGASLSLNDKLYSGEVRGVPFFAAPLGKLPVITGPVIVHIDLSYLQKLYKNEVATPLLKTTLEALDTLRQMKIPVLTVTLSMGNLEGRIGLDVRFLGEVIRSLAESPEIFDGPLPLNWRRQGDILYLGDFVQKEKIRELALAMELDEPQSAWVKFSLYRSAAESRDGAGALAYLGQAVAIDPVYALEYLNLADMALERGRPDESLRMLGLAEAAMPDNPQLRFRRAQLVAKFGRVEEAVRLAEELSGLNWSPVYFPELRSELTTFIRTLREHGTGEAERGGGEEPLARQRSIYSRRGVSRP